MEEQNNIVEPKKKRSIGLIILMVILMIGCLVGGYYLNESGVFDKIQKDTMDEKSKKEEKKEEKNVENNEAHEETNSSKNIEYEKYSNLISKLQVGFQCDKILEYINDKKVSVGDIKSMDIFTVITLNEFYGKKDSFTLDEFNEAIKKYFADGYNFIPTEIDYKTGCYQYSYDESTKTFNKQQRVCGAECAGPHTMFKVVNATESAGLLKIDLKVVFGMGEGNNYYDDYSKSNVIGKYDPSTNIDDNLYDKGSNYQFTFKLEGDNYVFVSSEPAK